MRPSREAIERRVAEVRELSSGPSSMLVALYDDRAAAIALLKRYVSLLPLQKANSLDRDTQEFLASVDGDDEVGRDPPDPEDDYNNGGCPGCGGNCQVACR